jgi:hypothetical protein
VPVVMGTAGANPEREDDGHEPGAGAVGRSDRSHAAER